MKKSITVLFAAAALAMCACGGNKKESLEQATARINEELDAIYADTTLTDAEYDAAMASVFREAYLEHKTDSLGLDMFRNLIVTTSDFDDLKTLFEKSSDLIKNDQSVKTKMQAVDNRVETEVGMHFKNIAGTDILTGDSLSIESMLAQGKRLLVDFWASWCPPCRREIVTNLVPLAEAGNVNIIGIAVWEDTPDDTRQAMSDLGITWPVIYTGGREDSPSIDYGVLGIPTLLLIDTDGTIIGRGYSIENFADLLQ